MKSLIIPAITPAGIPPEKDIQNAIKTGVITVHGAEGESWEQRMFQGAPSSFHDSCGRLLRTFSGRASGVLVLGTTGEGIGMGPLQSHVVLSAMKQACPENITLYAGVLGGDSIVGDQIRSAQSLGINNMVLGLNHTRDNTARFYTALEALDSTSKIFLYNLPTFKPANKEFILTCLEDPRVVGFKDSSGDPEFFSWLLSLKKEKKDFQVFHGNEAAYGQLSTSDFKRVDGLVSGNANVHPALLQAYTHNPGHKVHIHARSELHSQIVGLSGRPKTIDTLSKTSATDIEGHIHGLKRRLTSLCISPKYPLETILVRGQEALYSYKSGSLFQVHQ